jgi:hypothetical protein
MAARLLVHGCELSQTGYLTVSIGRKYRKGYAKAAQSNSVVDPFLLADYALCYERAGKLTEAAAMNQKALDRFAAIVGANTGEARGYSNAFRDRHDMLAKMGDTTGAKRADTAYKEVMKRYGLD